MRLTLDQLRIDGLLIFELACRTVGGAAASGGLAWNFPSTEYTGIVNSNKHLVLCDSSFSVATRRCSWILIAFMRALNPLSVSSYGALCAPLIADLFKPSSRLVPH